MGERIRALWQRIRDDIHNNPGLWIGVGITAIVAVIAYLAYRKANGQGVVPANGYGFPNYGSASGGSDSSGGSSTGYAPYQPISTISPAQPASSFTPTSSGVSVPATAFPPFDLTGSSFGLIDTPAAPNAYTVQGNLQNPLVSQTLQHTGATRGLWTILGSLQNPLAAQTLQHTGQQTGQAVAPQTPQTPQTPLAPAIVGLNPIQNPSAMQDAAHRGVTTPTTQTHVSVPTLIPTTIRPQTVTSRGRVA